MKTFDVESSEIVVVSDLGDASEKALSYGSGMARHYGCHLTLAHVLGGEGLITAPNGEWFVVDRGAQEAEKRLEELGAALREQKLQAESVELCGDIVGEVRALAGRRGADLIVVGTHARTGMRRLMFGSIAEQIAREAPCPVLVAGPAIPVTPTAEWQPRKILCALSLRHHSPSLIRQAAHLLLRSNAELILLPISESDRIDAPEEVNLPPWAKELLPPSDLPRIQVHWSIPQKLATEQILATADANLCDLIVVSSGRAIPFRDHLPFTLLSELFARSLCPVMAVPGE